MGNYTSADKQAFIRRGAHISGQIRKETQVESNKRWVAETIKDGKAEYISFIDIVGGGLKVELTDDVSKAIKYLAEFRANDDSQYVNSQLKNRHGSKALKELFGDRRLHARLLTPEELAV